MSKKIASLAVVLAFLVAMSAGCSQKSPSTSSSSSSAPNPNNQSFTVSVSSWDMVPDAATAAYKATTLYKQYVEKTFKQTYPNATIKWDNTASSDYFNILTAQLASGDADDVFFSQNNLVPFAKAGYLADLSNEPYASSILDSTKPAVMYQGKLVAMPQSIAGWACWYNATMFSDNGWTAPKTWDDFMTLCASMKAKGITPFVGGFKDSWTDAGWILADCVEVQGNNPSFETSLYNGTAKLNGSEYAKVMTNLQTLIQNGYYNKDCMSIGWDQSRAEFEQGKGAMIIQGSWLPGMVSTDVPSFKTGFMAIPDASGNTMLSYGICDVISANAHSQVLDKAKVLVGVLDDKTAVETREKNNNYSAIKGTNVEYDLQAEKDYSAAFANGKTAPQLSTYMPPSVWPMLNTICSSIEAGQKFDPKSLDAVQSDYDKDKALCPTPGQ